LPIRIKPSFFGWFDHSECFVYLIAFIFIFLVQTVYFEIRLIVYSCFSYPFGSFSVWPLSRNTCLRAICSALTILAIWRGFI
jgi:hypothetical protein